MKPTPKIRSLWIGPALSAVNVLCIKSFLRHGHEFHLYVYDSVKNIPEEVIVHDAAEVLPRNRIFKYNGFDSYAGFANLFRYKLLLENGGCWVDMDMICLKPFDFTGELLAGQFQKMKNRPQYMEANCCLIHAEMDSPIMRYCFETANQKRPESLRWGETGPELVTMAAKTLNMPEIVAPPEHFCPINWWEYNQIFDESLELSEFKESYAIHLWAEMWRRNGFNPNGVYPAKSLFETLKSVYLT